MTLPKKQCFDFPSLIFNQNYFGKLLFSLNCNDLVLGPKASKLHILGMFWNLQDLLFLMGTEIFKIDASWAEKLNKTRVSKILSPTVGFIVINSLQTSRKTRRKSLEIIGTGPATEGGLAVTPIAITIITTTITIITTVTAGMRGFILDAENN